MNLLSVGAAYAAGALTVLSPCILPVLPLVFGAASAEHRWGPAALALGVAGAFAIVGSIAAVAGVSLDTGDGWAHAAFGLLIAGVGVVLLTPRLQDLLARWAEPLAARANQVLAHNRFQGLSGQVGLGALLGAAWSPCAGPTLGAAILLASSGHNLLSATTVMLAFGLGAATPLLALGMGSRAALHRLRGRLGGASRWGKRAFGASLAAVGVLAITGLDHSLESLFLDHAPAWLLQLTTAI